MNKARKFSLAVSLVLGAGTLALGLIPEPLVFLAGVILLSLLVAVALRFKGWRLILNGDSESRSSIFGVGCVVATTLASLLRHAEWRLALVPAFSIAVTACSFCWLIRNVGIQVSKPSSEQ